VNELNRRILELIGHGFHCSQIMLLLSHEMRGVENPELIRALGGLGGGMFCRKNCGTLTGGSCLLSSFGARGSIGDEPKLPYRKMAISLVEWFQNEFGSITCEDLVEFEKEKILEKCPEIIEKTFIKCMDMLTEAGVDVND